MPERLVEVYRGDLVESIHFGHVVISNNIGKVLADQGKIVFDTLEKFNITETTNIKVQIFENDKKGQ